MHTLFSCHISDNNLTCTFLCLSLVTLPLLALTPRSLCIFTSPHPTFDSFAVKIFSIWTLLYLNYPSYAMKTDKALQSHKSTIAFFLPLHALLIVSHDQDQNSGAVLLSSSSGNFQMFAGQWLAANCQHLHRDIVPSDRAFKLLKGLQRPMSDN